MSDGETTERAPDALPATPSERTLCLRRLKKRRDFLAAARARKWSTPGFVLQGRPRSSTEQEAVGAGARIGFTASKKVGNAVARNRAKRRLRALSEIVLTSTARPDWDYVLIARAEATATRPFSQMSAELRQAVDRVHQGRSAPNRRRSDQKRRA
ncbi:MAG: ribonuclease P protein component [Rhodobacteraceae bacterium]|nr:ribonuclease P protein component [Paracoccaceae bacterium]